MNDTSIQMIDLATIVVPKSARGLDVEHANRLARSLGADGELFQAIGLIPDSDRHRIVWGRHRYEAYRILKRAKIPARVLPTDTEPEAEVRYSLQENDLRRKEDPEDVIARVELCASRLGMASLTQAAEFVGINKSTISRFKTLVKKLDPAVRQLAKQHKVGNSILYTIASHTKDADQQQTLLQAHLDGHTRDQLMAMCRGRSRSSTTRQRTRLTFAIGDSRVRLELPKEASYETMALVLKEVRTRLATQQKRNIPVRLLPEVIGS